MESCICREFVRDSYRTLRNIKIHPQFAGYLCLKWTSVKAGKLSGLKPNFKAFFELFLKMETYNRAKPYIFPFNPNPGSDENQFFNKNVAGSYAPSSLRDSAPFFKVAAISTQSEYSLIDSHWTGAKKNLLYNNKIPVIELATFLYRDFGIIDDDPSIKTLVDIFKYDFGYAQSDITNEAEFDLIYEYDTSKYTERNIYFERASE